MRTRSSVGGEQVDERHQQDVQLLPVLTGLFSLVVTLKTGRVLISRIHTSQQFVDLPTLIRSCRCVVFIAATVRAFGLSPRLVQPAQPYFRFTSISPFTRVTEVSERAQVMRYSVSRDCRRCRQCWRGQEKGLFRRIRKFVRSPMQLSH